MSKQYGLLLFCLQTLRRYSGKEVLLVSQFSEKQIKWLKKHSGAVIRSDLPDASIVISTVGVPAGSKARTIYCPYEASEDYVGVRRARIYFVPYSPGDLMMRSRVDGKDEYPPLELPKRLHSDEELETNILSGLTPPMKLEPTQKQLINLLTKSIMERDIGAVENYLASPAFSIVDDSDSVSLMRAAVASRSVGITKLILLESSPNACVNPGVMDNIALQDSILTGNKQVQTLIASNIYIKKPPRVYSVTVPREADNINWDGLKKGRLPSNITPETKRLIESEAFQRYFWMGKEQVKSRTQSEGIDDLVRDSHIHRVLLLCYRETKDEVFAQALCLVSSLRERQLKDKW